MQKTVAEIAQFVGGQVLGDADTILTGVNGIKEAKQGELTFVANSKYVPLVKETQASAIISSQELDGITKPVIIADNPSYAFSKAISLFVDDDVPQEKGVHPSAVVADDVQLSDDACVGPNAVIESGVQIGKGVCIGAGSFIGYKTIVGDHCELKPNVTVLEKTVIGNNVRIHSGTVIGADGFGYENIDGVHEKIAQIGSVLIEDDVEIGSCVTIDRARFDKTIIGQGTKIDNLVQIAHNCIIGKHCIIISQVGISGSVTVEDGAILAGQVGVTGHLTIGAGSIVAAKSTVTKSIPPGVMVSGHPAKTHTEAKRINAAVQRLPQYVQTIQELKATIEELKSKIDNK